MQQVVLRQIKIGKSQLVYLILKKKEKEKRISNLLSTFLQIHLEALTKQIRLLLKVKFEDKNKHLLK